MAEEHLFTAKIHKAQEEECFHEQKSAGKTNCIIPATITNIRIIRDRIENMFFYCFEEKIRY